MISGRWRVAWSWTIGVVLVAATASAQVPAGPIVRLVADLPTCNAGFAGRQFNVTDGADADDCVTGGGAHDHGCICDGSSWISFARTDDARITTDATGILPGARVRILDADGNGDYTTLAAALADLATESPRNANAVWHLLVMPGDYSEPSGLVVPQWVIVSCLGGSPALSDSPWGDNTGCFVGQADATQDCFIGLGDSALIGLQIFSSQIWATSGALVCWDTGGYVELTDVTLHGIRPNTTGVRMDSTTSDRMALVNVGIWLEGATNTVGVDFSSAGRGIVSGSLVMTAGNGGAVGIRNSGSGDLFAIATEVEGGAFGWTTQYVRSGSGSLEVDGPYETSSGTITPWLTPHTATHRHGGSDEVATVTPAADAIPKAGAGGTIADGWLSTNVSFEPDDTGTDDQTASEVAVTDAGGFFSGADVEAALQEIGPTMTDSRTPTAHDLAGALHTASGLTAGWTIRATGATTFAWEAIQDGDLPSSIARDAEVPSLETDPAACGNAACAVGTDDTVTLAQGTTPTPTVEGRIEWDTDDDRIVVGDGAGQATFFGGAHTVDTGPSPDCFGTSTYQDGDGNCDAVGGDLSGGLDAAQVADDSHDHSAAGSTVTINSADIVDLNAGTDPTADLEEEAHATEHQHGGADEVATATPAANAIPKAGAGGDLDDGWISSAFALDSEVPSLETDPGVPLLALADYGDVCAGSEAVRRNAGDTANECFTPGAGSSAFSDLTSGTNTTAAMVVGAGATLRIASTGVIGASCVDDDGDGVCEVEASGGSLFLDPADDGSPVLQIEDNGTYVRWLVNGSPMFFTGASGQSIRSTTSNGPALANANASATVPTLLPNRDDGDTGFGWGGANDLRVIAGGVSGLGQTATATTMYTAQVNDPKAQTCADSGDGNPGSLTMTVSGLTYKAITNADADGCAVTISETGAKDGQRLEVVIVSTAGGTVDFADTAGVTEIATAFAAGLWDSITLRYAADRWVEVSRSNN